MFLGWKPMHLVMAFKWMVTISLVISEASFVDLKFDVEPIGIVAIKGRSAILDCRVHSSSRDELSLFWLKDGTTLQDDSRRYKLENGSLYFEIVEHSYAHRPDEGMYQCKATVRTQGTIVSRKARLQVAYIKPFTDEPKNRAAHIGDLAMFPCRIEGAPHPVVRWVKDDKNIDVRNSNFVLHSDNTLEIRSVKSSDFGRYACVASNGIEQEKMSRVAQLTQERTTSVHQLSIPDFVMKPQDLRSAEGTSVVFNCGANGRDGKSHQPLITWFKDGVAVNFNRSSERSYLKGQGSFYINDIRETDGGNYMCRASNSKGSVDANVSLTVLVTPRFLTRPTDVEVQTNSDVELHCDAYASPRASLEWLKNGEVVIASDYFQLIDGRNLKILGLISSDSGMYQCTATNEVGMIQASAHVVVHQKVTSDAIYDRTPSSTNPSSGISDNLPKAPVDLVSSSISSSSVVLSWQPSPSLVEILGYMVTWQEQGSLRERVQNTTDTQASVRHLKTSTKYTFRVRSFNVVGFSQDVAEIVVETDEEGEMLPGVPTNVTVSVASSTSVRVTWGRPEESSEQVTHYKLYYYVVGDAASSESDINVVECHVDIPNLHKFCKYSFRVVAYNRFGPGLSSDEIIATTYSDIPSAAPQNVSAEAVGSTTIAISWEPPPEGSQNGIISGYELHHKLHRDRNSETTTKLDANQRSHDLTGLEKGTKYSFHISALTVNGSGPATSWTTLETPLHDLDESTVPGKPTSLRVRPTTNTVMVSWTPPVEQDIMIRGYVLGYGIGIPDIYRQILDGRQRYHTIKALKPSSEYVISLKAFNNVGEGIPIYETTFTREETTPEPQTPMMPPVGLKTIVGSSTSVFASWSDSTLARNQRISDSRSYIVRYNQKFSRKYKHVNVTELSATVDDLRPDTEYEFSVKVVKGNRQSTWSLSVFNKTKEAAPSTSPRDLTVVASDEATRVVLNWQPPRQTNGQITGYIIYYSLDATLHDSEWVMEIVRGERLSTTLGGLTPETTYFFKLQARNDMGQSPVSPTIIFRTPGVDGTGGGMIETPDDFGGKNNQYERSLFKNNHNNNWQLQNNPPINETPTTSEPFYMWLITGCIGGFITFAILIVIAVVYCRCNAKQQRNSNRKDVLASPKSKQNTSPARHHNLKPPDLWIHGDNMELSEIDQMSEAESATIGRRGVRSPRDKTSPSGFREEERYRSASLRPAPVIIPVDTTSAISGFSNDIRVTVAPSQPSAGYPPYFKSPYASAPRVNVVDMSQSSLGSRHGKSSANGSSSFKNPRTMLDSPSLQLTSPQLCLSSHALGGGVGSLARSADENTHLPTCISTEDLSEEMANIEGLMKDLNNITRQQFVY